VLGSIVGSRHYEVSVSIGSREDMVEEPVMVLLANTLGIVVGLISERRFGKIGTGSHKKG